MYPVAELLEGRVGVVEDDRLVVVRDLSLWLGVDADHVTVVPHLLEQLQAGNQCPQAEGVTGAKINGEQKKRREIRTKRDGRDRAERDTGGRKDEGRGATNDKRRRR